ncbi:hypothetical protein [Flavobacterium beibuense]|uniref:Putative Lipoprotein n=1 Tax=Flavobacterium beibuense TaxID=657326 RepID=A0A444WIJ0_9FLAO|nr:hypothetical protein [Flavobacterium beibuense]RYJ45678.1 putative Lipoprotein [Flavobacterium beibuense]
MKKLIALTLSSVVFLFSCSNSDDSQTTAEPNLVIKLKFDKNQVRLNNFGQPSEIGEGNAAQTPLVNYMSAHYIELAPSATTLLGEGEIVYKGEETTAGGSKAIDFSKAILGQDGEVFLTIPLSQVAAGDYSWVRVSVSYQNGTIKFLSNGNELTGTMASFIGYNNYITSFDINGNTVAVNSNKLQGYWAFETLGFIIDGQAPEGAVTVPNPLFESSPIPQGSCVLTGQFANGLSITGNETKDITINLSFSIKDSFEWNEVNADGKFEPAAGETLTDMGLRGLIPYVTYQ